MNKIKRILFRFFFSAEIFLFAHMYFFERNGLIEIWSIERESVALSQQIQEIQQKIVVCEQEKERWVHDSFYKEKCAREQLNLARADEEIFYLD